MSSVSDPTPLHASETPAAAHGHAEHGHGGHEHGLAHITPWQTLVVIWAILMALTILTVMATWVDLGTLNIWIALGIAVIKGTLVVLYFMHLKYDRPFNGYVFAFAFAFVAVFLGFIIIDTRSYHHTVEKRYLDELQLPTDLQNVKVETPQTTAPAGSQTNPAPTKENTNRAH
jgi:cytochrome c oxidase subunit IV